MKTTSMSIAFRSAALLLTLFCCGQFLTAQNCTLQVVTNADTVLCAPGASPLRATITGGTPISVAWTPTAGVANPAQANTVATVNVTTTYTVTTRSLSTTNLITNGDFSQGNTGFTSDYILGTSGSLGPLTQEGRYVVVANAGTTHTQFANCNDHTTGNGLMMVVNASGQANDVWCQNITVNANTDYDFSAWVTSVTSQNPARLQFSINGALLGNQFNASSATCNWQQFAAQWNSGATTSAQICIVNVNLTPAGNDFALDDIRFREICTATDSVTVTIANLQANFSAPAVFCQESPALDPATWLAANATPGGAWTLDNQPLPGAFDPAALSPGPHTLGYRVSLGSCTATVTQSITVEAPPQAGTAAPARQLCAGATEVVDLNAMLTGADAGGAWTEISPTPSQGGAFNPGAATFTAGAQAAGSYRFRYITAAATTCPPDTAEVEVVVNALPVADAGPDVTLDCSVPEVLLGSAATPVPGWEYNWLRDGGALHTGSQARWNAVAAGQYVLVVRDVATGCAAQDETTVTSLINTITAQLDATQAGCDNPNGGSLAVTNPGGGTAPYLYGLNDGMLQANASFEGLAPGDYTVTVQDAAGCQVALAATLFAPTDLAVNLQVSGDSVIQPGEQTRLLVSVNLPANQLDTIIWQPAIPGCAGCDNPSVSPDQTTLYTVTVVDDKGCSVSASQTIRVFFDLKAYTPNAFSPNDDGVNDHFFVHAGDALSTVSLLRIVDRWGGLVFETVNQAPNQSAGGWNGKYRGQPALPGLYVYYAELTWADGQTSWIAGEVTLVR